MAHYCCKSLINSSSYFVQCQAASVASRVGRSHSGRRAATRQTRYALRWLRPYDNDWKITNHRNLSNSTSRLSANKTNDLQSSDPEDQLAEQFAVLR